MTSKRVLFYYSSNRKTVALETLCQSIKNSGHDIRVLTICEKGIFHNALQEMGIKTFNFENTSQNSLSFFFTNVQYLIKFCKEHQIDEVWSHLSYPNVIATLAQPFLTAKVTVFRHHAESAFYAEFGKQFEMKRLWKEVLIDKFINKFAKKIIIPSTGVWFSMDLYEKCDMKKVSLVPYIYDFSSYAKPNQANILALKEKYSCQLRLIMVSRMVPSKQHLLVFEILNELITKGLDLKMILMDEGPLRSDLENWIPTEYY
jgi:glycosyltransferase involved in cell wall biosynthesis